MTNADLRPQVFLRSYQAALIRDVRAAFAGGAKSVLAVAPTGSGKTVTFSQFTKAAAALGYRVAILAHRAEILDQIGAALERVGIEFGTIAPGAPATDHPVQVASVATLARRLKDWGGRFDFLIIDEAHHAVAGSWGKIIAANPKARVFGVTATPERLDGRGLGDVFGQMIEGPATGQLIAEGHLSPFVVFAPSDAPDLSGVRTKMGDYDTDDLRHAMGGLVIGSAVAEYQRLAACKKAIAFCVDIAHSRAVAAAFCAAGVRAAHVDGETPADARHRMIAALGEGGLDVVCNCGLISEGLDVPGIEAAILLRPTQSLALYLQQVGRALRVAPGKDRAIILDFTGNSARHDLPDAPREWSLESKPRRKHSAERETPAVRRCNACGAVSRRSVTSCPECGANLLTRQEQAEIAMQLELARQAEEFKAVRSMSYADKLRWAAGDEAKLRMIQRACGYQRGWVFHRLTEMGGHA